jgi:hypothetical protein
MHENAARALQYYEDLPRRSGRPELRLVDSEPRHRRDRHGATEEQPQRQRREPEHRAARARPRPRRQRPQPLSPPRPQAAAPRLAGRPDRVAMWAVLLGFFLTAVAAATGHG